ncbi:hypothetical protein DN730_00385 [Marinomonas piezotolerans]|uniref:HTH luxR-type domain-containing protein n=1 Tax=Marinomonas piezotolerans TaxID=2213058 RepID=A0A370UCM6_9GAMM|nr:LuxR family transcriptional regulator [Marinomonas piezotolerans]RDL45546.1 hypothetical protein DN730_00385 [Marinomonas piezotolerans]
MTIMDNSLFQSVPELIGAIGEPCFYSQVGVCFSKISTVSNFKVFSYPKADKPALLAGFKDPELDQLYCDFAYQLDPFYDVINQHQNKALVTLDSITRHDFESSAYYDRFYHKIGWKNEANLIVSLNDERTICLAYTADKTPIHQLNSELRPYLESIKSAIQKHEALLSTILTIDDDHHPSITHQSTNLTAQERFMDQFGLTKREKEVVRYILQGLASASIAEKCFVSEGTIKNHRKNIYRKLCIHSQRDLFRKFLN